MNELIELRHELHKYPEISNKEFDTSRRIERFVKNYAPNEIIELGETGKAFVFDSGKEGQTLMFRAELDALPIMENNTFDYCSVNKGVAHSCGHDGHMTIVAGMAKYILENKPQKGRVVLLFQPAEECEQGARDMVEHPNFKKIEPDFIFGLHNIPKAPKHQIIVKEGSFAAASKGMTIRLIGKSSHAAEPEKGKSPAEAISKIIQQMHELRDNKEYFKSLILLTIVHVQLGEIAFGTSPGYAEMRVTLRSFDNTDMEILTKRSEAIVKNIANAEELKYEIDYSEVFPAVENDSSCYKKIVEAVERNNLVMEIIGQAFKWSEDFSYYSRKYKAGFFGIGAGENQPALHNPEYDFPDEIIETGVKLLSSIYEKINCEA